MRRLRWAFLAALLLAGCTRAFQVPAPIMYGSLDPFETLNALERTNEVAVFYATDRNPEESEDPGERYGNKVDRLRFGRARVRLGDEGDNWEALHKASIGGRGLEASVSAVNEFDGTAAFTRAIDKALDESPFDDVFLFLPGYNTEFAWPVAVMGQYRHYSNRQGVFLSYCWPAKGTGWTYGTYADRGRGRDLEAARRRLRLGDHFCRRA